MAGTYVGTTSQPLAASNSVSVTRSVTAGNVLTVWYRSETANNRSYSISQSAGIAITFTNRVDTANAAPGSDILIWTGIAGTTESITLAVTVASGLTDTGDFGITEVSGADTTTPVRGTGKQDNNSAVSNHDMLGTGVDVSAGDFVLGSFRLVNSTSAVITPPSGATAIITESTRGGLYYKEFSSGSVGEIFRATSGTARTSTCGGIVIAGTAAATSFAWPMCSEDNSIQPSKVISF